MQRNFSSLPFSFFPDKYVRVPFLFYDAPYKVWNYEQIWVKVVRTWGNWLVGRIDNKPCHKLCPDQKIGDEVFFLRSDVADVMGKESR